MLKKLKIQISIKIEPRMLNDPDTAINKKLSKYLFKYSYKLGGIPLCYKILGIYPIGEIFYDNDCVFLKTMVELSVFKFKVGDILYSDDGTVFGIIYTKVDGNEEYTGDIKVFNIEVNQNGYTVILGNAM